MEDGTRKKKTDFFNRHKAGKRNNKTVEIMQAKHDFIS